MLWFLVFIILTGLALGSFLGAFTYRLPKGISMLAGRSFCPVCKKKIVWLDNIPVVSYLLLRGKCRNCGHKISARYPLIEATMTGLFVLTFYSIFNCSFLSQSPICLWSSRLGLYSIPLLLIIFFLLASIFVIDLEHQIIPDGIVFTLIFLLLAVIILFYPALFYANLFAGFAAALFLLFLNLITRGRGMGLGDVKLAIFGGLLLGPANSVVWMFLSFILGAVVGVVLLGFNKTKFGKHIPFGPFLVMALIVTLIYGNLFLSYLKL